MELTPVTPQQQQQERLPLTHTPTDFTKQQMDILSNDIKTKADQDAIKLTGVEQDFLYNSTTPNALDALADNKIKFNDFNIDVREAYKPLNSGEMIPMYDNYIKGTNNEERFALGQSTGSKLGNGIVKLGGKTLTAVLGGTLGSVVGIIDWAKTGSFQSTYDNNFNDWLDDLNTKMDYKLPNYYTEQEKDNNVLQSAGTVNFWANDVLGGLSFTLGTVVSEGLWAWATGGASLGTTAARIGTKIGEVGSLFRVGKLAGEAAEIASASNKIQSVIKAPLLERYLTGKISPELATSFGKAGELANTARFTYTSAGFESGQEARNYMREARQNFDASFREQNGRPPTSEERANFENNLGDAANSLFAFNMAIVGSSNLAIFGKTLGVTSPIKTPTKWANEAFFGIGVKKTAAGTLEEIVPTRLQNIAAKSFSILEVPFTEGVYEEGMQSAGQNSAQRWIKSTYDPKYMGNTMDIGTAFAQGMGETYGGKEGWKEIGIGALIGLFSGAGLSVARGNGLFGELNEARAKNAEEAKSRNEYSVDKVLGWVHTANRVTAFNEAGEAAEEKGDITGAELSRASAMIAHITNAHNFGYTSQALDEFRAGVNSMDNETLKKQYGLETDQEVQDLKSTLYTEYADLTKEYGKQRKYVDYMINNNSTEFKGVENLDDVKEAVAYELTLGSKAYDFSKELLVDLQSSLAKNYNTSGQSMSNALEVQDILMSASKDIKKEFRLKQKELKSVRLEKEELEKQRLSLEKSKNSKEDNKADLNRLNAVVVDIEAATTKSQQLETELQGVLATAQLQNPYNKSDQAFITSEELENVDESLKSISKLIEDYKNANPREGYRLEGILKEYQKSKVAFTRYADLARQMRDPKLGLRGKRNIISELASDKTPSAVTLEFVKGMSENMQRIKEERALEAAEVNSNVEGIKKESMQRPSPTKSVSTVQEIIENNPYLFEYVGTADNITKPSEEEITEYKDFVRKIKRSKKIDNERATRNAPNYYAKKGVKIPLSKTEMARFQELNQKMSDWRFYEGAFNSEGISIADLIEQELSRNEEITEPIVQDELTVDDFVQVSTPEEVIPNKRESEFRKSSIIQTYENVKVQVRDNNYQFSHLKVSSVLSKIKSPYTIVMTSPTAFDENGYAEKWGKPKEVTFDDVLENQNKYATKFNIVTEEGEIPITVMEYGRLQIPIANFSKVKKSLGFDIFKQLTTNTTYSDLYEEDEEGNLTQKASDFGIGESEIPYTPEEVLNTAPGTNTFFKINIEDSYNEELKDKYEKGEINLDAVINQVKVYNTGANGKVLGDLKSNREIFDETDNYLEIRRIAADILLNKDSKQGLVTIPYTAKAAYVLLGTPNLTMIKTDDGVIPQSINITDQALERIEDFGFIEKGNLQLKGNTKNVRLDFVSKISKKANVPVVIFKEGNYNVAYPVSLIKRDVNKAVEVQSILSNTRINRAEKATQINSILSENGIKPNLKYITEEDQNIYNEDGSPSAILQSNIYILQNKKETVDVKDWFQDSYNKENLKDDVTITVNLEERVLKSPKLVIDFKNAERNDSENDWYDNYISTGEISEEQINIISNKAVEAGLNLTVQQSYLNRAEVLGKRKNVVNREIVKLSDELKYTTKNSERASEIEAELSPLKTELQEIYRESSLLQANPSLALVSKEGVFSAQELDVYNKEKDRIKKSINEIVSLSSDKEKQSIEKQNEEC